MPKPIQACRICGNPKLTQVLDLGEQALTGVFPATPDQQVTVGPLQLVLCTGDAGDVCGLLQLRHSYDLGEMYGDNYGYRSGLNASMVKHLHAKVAHLLEFVSLQDGDLVIDIGSNDGTTLGAYPANRYRLLGIDPTGSKFSAYYPPGTELIPDFFSADLVRRHSPGRKAKVVTSFSMFYDLEDPLGFMRQIHDVLDDDGIWVFEQSYMPLMLDMNSYDTVCHEHLEYYGLRQIKWLTDQAGFRILEVAFNDVNGGSFSVTVAKSGARSAAPAERERVDAIVADECRRGLDTLRPYQEFAERVAVSRAELLEFLARARASGQSVYALGASTKGNVLLQYCGIGSADVRGVGEVNPEKFGRLTPGTKLPILAEDAVLAERPDYMIVLPWHFRRFFESSPRFGGCRLVFPLPRLDIVDIQ